MLNEKERQRYARQLMIREIGETGQKKLKQAHVLVAGVGGLGSPIALYLAAAGVGHLRLVDNDRVDYTNLNRQVLHWTTDVGRPKTESAADKLPKLNDVIEIETLHETIDEKSETRLTKGIDIIMDATDNLETRFVLNAAALKKGIPFIHGAVAGFEGRMTVIIPGKTPCLGCIYHGNIPKQKTPVLGATPAVVGTLQVTEAIKYITGAGQLLAGQLLVYDGLHMKFTTLTIKKDPNCRFCGHMPAVG